MLNGFAQKNSEQFEENKDDLVRALKTLGRPIGAEIENVKSFFRSYDKGHVGPNGEYGVYDQHGRLRYYSSFKDLWLEMWGFSTATAEENKKLNKEIRNAQFDQSKAKQDALELMQQEKYDQANEIIDRYGIRITPGDFDKYFIPLTERTFINLSPTLKEEFAGKVFPKP